jgi:hypothetical protein
VTRTTLSTLCLSALTLSCASDYKVHGEDEALPGYEDTAAIDRDPPEDSAEPVDEEETGHPVIEEPEPDAPVAVCEVTPDKIRPITGSATWIGTDSYDPNGLALIDYEWILSDLPAGSATSMPGGTDVRNDFTPDLAGEYTGRLVVTNEEGIKSDPCEVTLEAEPGEALWVEMFWENSGDDMDLHLIAPGGTFQNSMTDCYYMNCTPSSWSGGLDWGAPGNTIDDPTLDLDDISTTGPENINIEEPEDATYTVIVHDYPGSVYTAGNAVTINIYLDGSLSWTDTRVISGEDTQTRFAEIDAGASIVIPL